MFQSELATTAERKEAAALRMTEAALHLVETMAACLAEESYYHTAAEDAMRKCRLAARQMAPMGQRAS